jgi:hypothetical protein
MRRVFPPVLLPVAWMMLVAYLDIAGIQFVL